VRGALDGVVEVELVGAPVRANLRRRRSAILMLRVPSSTWSSRSLNSRRSTLHGALVVALAADADAFGIVAGVAERRGATGADPLLAALMAAFLLLEALAQGLQQLVEAAHRLDLFFSSSVRYFSEILRSHSSGISAVSACSRRSRP